MIPERQSASPREQSPVSVHVVPTSKAKALLLMEILIRWNDGVKPMRDMKLIAETAWVTVATVRKRFRELNIEPIADPGESAVSLLVGREGGIPASKVKEKNEGVPPLTHWDTLAPWQKEVVGAFYWYDGTQFDGIPRKDITTIACERGTTYAGVYGLLQWGLKKLRSVERPTRKKRESKKSKTGIVKHKRVLSQSSVRPTHAAIPEEQTQTYEDLLAWLRMPENESLVTSFEETVRLAKLKHSTYSPAQLAPKIIEKFREGFLGHAIFSLAYYLKPEVLVQNFIREIRPPVHVLQVKPVPAPLPVKPVPKATPLPRKTEPLVVSPSATKPTHTPAVFPSAPIPHTTPTVICPTFEFKSDALAWLREQSKYKDLIIKSAQEKDEKGMNALLVREESLLLRILFKIKTDCNLWSIADIVHHVFPEESKPSIVPTNSSTVPPTHTSSIASEPIIATGAWIDGWDDLQITPEHEAIIRAIVGLHQEKKYREFWDRCQALAGTSVLAEIQQIKDTFQHRSILESIFFIAGQEITEKEKDLYRKHHWADRIASFSGVASQLQRLLDHEDNKSMKVLKKFLEDVKIFVPLKREWQWFEEKELEAAELKKKEREKEKYVEPNLFDAVVWLVKTRKTYKKKDEESTKKLLRVVKQIIWSEEVIAEDEDIEDSE